MATQPPASLTCCSRWQADAQAFLGPAEWIPGLRQLRRHKELWRVSNCGPEDTLAHFLAAVEYFHKSPDGEGGLMGGETLWIRHAKGSKRRTSATVYCFTAKAEWLDVIEIDAVSSGGSSAADAKTTAPGACDVAIRSFSTGLWPTSVPLSPLWSSLCCFFPFLGRNSRGHWNNNVRVYQILVWMKERAKCAIQVTNPNVIC